MAFFGSAFFGGDFFFSGVLPLIDTHDGDEKKRDKEIRDAKDRLKSQLETAFESAFQKRPQNVAPKVETVEFDDEDDWLILL